MRKKIIIAGIILLILGILLFLYGNNQYNHYKEKKESGYIEIPNTNNITDYEAEMNFGSVVSYIGLFTLFIGILLIISSFILK